MRVSLFFFLILLTDGASASFNEKPACVAGNPKNQDLIKTFYNAEDDAPLKMFWEWRNQTINQAWREEAAEMAPTFSEPSCKICLTNLRDIAVGLMRKIFGGGPPPELRAAAEPEKPEPRVSQSIKYECIETVVKQTNFGSPKPQYICENEEQRRMRQVPPLPRPAPRSPQNKGKAPAKAKGTIARPLVASSGPSVGPCVTEEILLYMTWLINEAAECLAEPNLRLDPIKILEMINNESKFSFLTSYGGGSGLTQVVAGRGAYTEMHRLQHQGANHLRRKVSRDKKACKPFQEVVENDGVKFPCSVLHPGSGLARAVIYGVGYYDYMLSFADRKLHENNLSPRQTTNRTEMEQRLALATDLATAAYSNAGPGNALPKLDETLAALDCKTNGRKPTCGTPNIRSRFREMMNEFYSKTKLPGGAPRPSYFNNIVHSSRLLPKDYKQECAVDNETLQQEQVNKLRGLFKAAMKGE